MGMASKTKKRTMLRADGGNFFTKYAHWVLLAPFLILFIVFYPVLTGITVKQGYVDALKWFSTWYF